jgi:hypothetical protein
LTFPITRLFSNPPFFRGGSVIDEIGSVITLCEETLRLEITMPSLIQGLQSTLAHCKAVLAQVFFSPFRGWCYVA